jgi:signal transduction histidine kinase
MSEPDLRVLLVEDIPVYVTLIKRLLESDAILVTAHNLETGLQEARAGGIDAILLDLGLPDCQGLETLTAFMDCRPDIPVVILTGLDDEEMAAKAVQEGAQDYLVKGPYLTQGEAGKVLLLRSLRYAIERHQVQAALRRDRDLLEMRVAERTAELQEANLKMRWYYERLNILREIDHAALEAKSPEDIARIALKQFGRLVPYDYADILIIHQENTTGSKLSNFPTEQVTVLAKRMDGKAQQTGELFVATELLVNDRLRRGKEYQIHDLDALLVLSPYEKRLRQHGVRAYLMVPLIAEGKLIGAINLGQQIPQTFSKEHVGSARQLASQLALMLYNARLYEQVRAAQARLRELTERLVSAQEDERQRISLELHDEAGQALTALNLKLALIQANIPQKSPEIKGQLAEAIMLSAETMDRIRSLAHDLHPPALDAVGLNQAMEDYCQRITNKAGVQVDYSGTEVSGLPGYYQINLYRVLQEALTNVIKHAKASHTSVDLKTKDDQILLKVSDNGTGFIYRPVLFRGEGKGMGLQGITERIEALGGSMEIFSQPGEGTTLLVQVPWRQKG